MSILLRRLAVRSARTSARDKLKYYSSKAAQEPQFLGAQSDFTDVLEFVNKESYSPIPIYRIMKSKLIPNIERIKVLLDFIIRTLLLEH